MKTALTLVVMMLAAAADASPYFRLMRPLDEVKTGMFFKVGTPVTNTNFGAQTTLIKHFAEDGYILLPGVSWSALDVGGFKPTNGGNPNVVIGPSIDLSEPVKALLLSGLDRLGGGGLGSLRALLQPAKAGQSCAALSVGPSLGVDPGDLQDARTAKGYLLIHAGLSAKWGAP